VSSDDGGYVHDPDSFRESERLEESETPGKGEDEDAPETGGETGSDEFGTDGWVLVGLLVVCLFVIPGVILVRPPGLPWEAAFLVLPLIPGVLLGGAAVWLAVRHGP